MFWLLAEPSEWHSVTIFYDSRIDTAHEMIDASPEFLRGFSDGVSLYREAECER